MRRVLLFVLQATLVVAATAYGTFYYLVDARRTLKPPAPLTEAQLRVAASLRTEVEALSALDDPTGVSSPDNVARHIEKRLASFGYAIGTNPEETRGSDGRNIEVVIEPAGGADPALVVVGTHYRARPGSPSADARSSGVAAALELARRLIVLQGKNQIRLRLAFFGDAPRLGSGERSGSERYIRSLQKAGESVTAMYSLDALGVYSSAPGSQSYGSYPGWGLPERADFLAFVGPISARVLLKHTLTIYRNWSHFPVIGALIPSFLSGIAVSDHLSFAAAGVPALMITDTGPYRNPRFGSAADTPETLDYEKLSLVVNGIESTLISLIMNARNLDPLR